MTYRVGIIGAGGITIKTPPKPAIPPLDRREVYSSHVGCLSILPEVEVSAICDIAPAALEQFGQNWSARWPETRTYSDYRRMLEQEDLDILTVATPDNRHAQVVVDGAQSGVKGILCEKPIATTLEEVDRMIAACEDNEVKLSIDHTRRWSPLFHKVRGVVSDGVIGPLSLITGSLGGPRAMLFRNGTHLIDAMCFFAQSNPRRVSAFLEDGFDDWDQYRGDGGKQADSEPGATGTIEFENGIRAIYRGIKGTLPLFGLELAGPKGQITFALDDRSAQLTTQRARSLDPVRTTLSAEHHQVQGLVAAYQELIEIIENGGESISSPYDARKALQIILGFLKSHQEGSRLVEVPS